MITQNKLLFGLLDRQEILGNKWWDLKQLVWNKKATDETHKELKMVNLEQNKLDKAILKALDKAQVPQGFKDEMTEIITVPLIPLEDPEPEQGVLLDTVEQARQIFG